jgi:hypothetical protein
VTAVATKAFGTVMVLMIPTLAALGSISAAPPVHADNSRLNNGVAAVYGQPG